MGRGLPEFGRAISEGHEMRSLPPTGVRPLYVVDCDYLLLREKPDGRG